MVLKLQTRKRRPRLSSTKTGKGAKGTGLTDQKKRKSEFSFGACLPGKAYQTSRGSCWAGSRRPMCEAELGFKPSKSDSKVHVFKSPQDATSTQVQNISKEKGERN